MRIDFEGDPVELLGWILLAIPSALLAFPFPWFIAAFCRWFCRNLFFSDGATAEFRGRCAEILGWSLVPFAGAAILMTRVVGADFAVTAAFGVLIWLATCYSLLRIIRWCVARTVLGAGERFRFTGAFAELLLWQIVNGLAGLTVIGWGWTNAAMYRWAASHTRSEHRDLSFHGSGFEVLWRALAVALFSLPIVTIPWAKLWYLRWIISQLRIGSRTSFDDED